MVTIEAQSRSIFDAKQPDVGSALGNQERQEIVVPNVPRYGINFGPRTRMEVCDHGEGAPADHVHR